MGPDGGHHLVVQIGDDPLFFPLQFGCGVAEFRVQFPPDVLERTSRFGIVLWAHGSVLPSQPNGGQLRFWIRAPASGPLLIQSYPQTVRCLSNLDDNLLVRRIVGFVHAKALVNGLLLIKEAEFTGRNWEAPLNKGFHARPKNKI